MKKMQKWLYESRGHYNNEKGLIFQRRCNCPKYLGTE